MANVALTRGATTSVTTLDSHYLVVLLTAAGLRYSNPAAIERSSCRQSV